MPKTDRNRPSLNLEFFKSLPKAQRTLFYVFAAVYLLVFVTPISYVLNVLVLRLVYANAFYAVFHHLLIAVALYYGWVIGFKVDRRAARFFASNINADAPFFGSTANSHAKWRKFYEGRFLFTSTLTAYVLLITPPAVILSLQIDRSMLYHVVLFLITDFAALILLGWFEESEK